VQKESTSLSGKEATAVLDTEGGKGGEKKKTDKEKKLSYTVRSEDLCRKIKLLKSAGPGGRKGGRVHRMRGWKQE